MKYIKLLRETIRSMLLERRVWGIAGAGIIVCCSEDGTAFLQQRSHQVSGGRGKWAYPGGGIHIGHEQFWNTPIPQEHVLDDNSELFIKTALDELDEEVGWVPNTYQIIDSHIYEYEGFKYKTIIINVPLVEKQNYSKKTEEDQYSWEIIDEGWFTWDEISTMQIWDRISPEILNKVQTVIG